MMTKHAIPIFLLVAGYAPLLFLHFKEISEEKQYQYWPFVVAAVAFLLWSRSSEQLLPDQGKPRYTNVVFFLALLMLVAGGALFAPWVAAMSAMLAIGAFCLSTAKIRNVVNAFGIWLLGWLVIPLPFGLDGKLVRNLQYSSSLASSYVLDLMGINHLMVGNSLQVPGKEFFVDEACSGIVSVMSIITVAAICVVWANRGLIHSLLLIASGIVWAVILNICRIVIIAIAFSKFEIDLSKGTPHDMLGLCLFLVTFGALVSTDKLLQFFLAGIEFSEADKSVEQENVLIRAWNRFVSFGDPVRRLAATDEPGNEDSPAVVGPGTVLSPWFAIAFALVGLLSGGVLVMGAMKSGSVLSKAEGFSASTLPDNVATWTKVDYSYEHREDNELFGEYSNSFTYELNGAPDNSVTISFDYPFPAKKGWKELSVCYRSLGWTMINREILNAQSSDGRPWNFIRAEFEREGQRGHLCFGHFDGTGEPVSPPHGRWNHAIWARTRRFKAYTQSPHLFQSQAWLVTDGELSPEMETEFRKLHLSTREQIRGAFLGQPVSVAQLSRSNP